MSAIINAITNIINAAFVGSPANGGTPAVPSWISTAVTTITSNPLILIAVVLPFVGLGIGLLKRLFSARA